jgi:transcriptional regulator with XRE-family HTH domain
MTHMVNGRLLRAARGLLGLRQDEVAKATGLGVSTIRRIEAAAEQPTGHAATLVQLSLFFETQNIEFIDEGSRYGVILKSYQGPPRLSKNNVSK